MPQIPDPLSKARGMIWGSPAVLMPEVTYSRLASSLMRHPVRQVTRTAIANERRLVPDLDRDLEVEVTDLIAELVELHLAVALPAPNETFANVLARNASYSLPDPQSQQQCVAGSPAADRYGLTRKAFRLWFPSGGPFD
jgi:hypothetical protein